MRVALASDLHLEYDDIELKNEEKADVLLLAGDICVAAELEGSRSNRLVEFFKRVSQEFKFVIYVMGNHEHYKGDFANTAKIIREVMNRNQLDNVVLLDKEWIKVGDVTFVGGTLWTDMNKEDPWTLYHIKNVMADFQHIEDSNEVTKSIKFTPEDSVKEHRKMMDFLRMMTDVVCTKEDKIVVVGHHAPSKLSTAPQYQDQQIMNGAFSSDLSEFMLDHPSIKLWVHGHTHDAFDYMIGETRVVCNPRGYHNYEEQADVFELKYLDI
jgi:predicted phosphodiesterase